MPEPTRNFSTEKPIYNFLHKYVSPCMCKYNVHPIFLTCLNILLTLFLYNLIRRGVDKYTVLALMICYSIMDDLDGIVARDCKKQSKLGALLDHVSDGIYTFMHLFILFNLLKKNKKYKKYLSVYILFVVVHLFSYIYNVIYNVFYNKDFNYCTGFFPGIPCSTIFHDNTLLLHILTWFVIYNNKSLYKF